MVTWNIGCSGFHYKHWKGVFYPDGLPQKKWFDYYCQHFNTLELNVTFYRFPRLPIMQFWRQNSPDGFRFAVKAPRAITHFKKFLGTVDMLSDFYNTCQDGLQEKLGCVLFQMSPRLGYSEAFLERIISSLDNSFLNVVEFRHESWWRQEVYDELAKHNISFCGMSHPTLPKDVITNTDLLYYRFHGEEALYASLYSSEKLKETIDVVGESGKVKQAFIFFNNDIHGHAIQNASEMKSIVLSR